MLNKNDSKIRVVRLRTIERLRLRLHEIANWKLAENNRKKEDLNNIHKEMTIAMNEGISSYGLISLAASRHIRSIEKKIEDIHEIHKNLEKDALEQGRLAKISSTFLDQARDELSKNIDRKNLEELISLSLYKRPASGKS